MPQYLLHGLWLPESGLNIWVEQVSGHRVITFAEVPEGTFPQLVTELLAGNHFRGRAAMQLQTPKGKHVTLRAPTATFSPTRTVELLEQLSLFDGGQVPLEPAHREAIAPDLWWLIRVYRGLTQFVRAGRVSIHVPKRDAHFYAQWKLGTGVEERGWLAQMVAAAPGVIMLNDPNISEDMAQTLTHWIATARLHAQEVPSRVRPYPWHDFVASLVFGTPLRRGGAALVSKINDWGGSITAVNLQLVFLVEAPDDEPEDAESVEDAESAGELQWPVRVQVRAGTDAPRPVRQSDYDAQTAQTLRDSLQRAIDRTELVDYRRHPRTDGTIRELRRGDWDCFLSTEEIVRFVETEASKLQQAGFTVMLPKAWSRAETTAKLHVTKPDNPYDSSTVTRIGFDQLVQYDWRMSLGDSELTDREMQELISSKTGLVKLRGEWVLANGKELSRTRQYMQRLQRSALEQAKEAAERTAHLAELAEAAGSDDAAELRAAAEEAQRQYQDLLDNEGTGVVSAAELRQLALESLTEEPIEFSGSTWFTSLLGGQDRPAPERVEIPASVHAELREYQRRGVDWLDYMSRNNLGAVLADDMGLGKTLQLLALLAVEREAGRRQGPTLVVAPTSVVGNWAREAARFVPELRVVVHHGAGRAKGAQLREKLQFSDLVITSYGVVGRDTRDLATVNWDHVVCDEAQAIKNSGTQASKSVRAIPARHRIALTGTPIENKLAELRSLLDWVNPGMLGSQAFFRNHFAKAIETRRDEALADEMGERLQRLTAPFILRRVKTDAAIIDDLPEKREHVLAVDMTKEQAALYTALVNDTKKELERREGMARRGLVLATITRIKQVCNHPAHFLGDGSPMTMLGRHRSGKVAKLMDLLFQAVETDQRVLIFTQYKAFGDLLQPYLSEQLGDLIPFLHGGVGKSARDAMVERFQRDDGPRAMILSLKAGGTGLNLTAASVVIHMDRWWNPAVENQATDRAFRIGQRRDVTVYKMITKGTMEESIQDILDGKMQLAGTVVGEGEGWITELDTEDLSRLISYRGRHE